MMRKVTLNAGRVATDARLCRAIAVLAIALVGGMCGCHIPNTAYRVAPTSIITVPPPPKLPMAPRTAWPPHPERPCEDSKLLERPCLAFLEFDEFGEPWQKSPSGRPTQLDRVRNLIFEAKRQDPTGQPLILAFIHGWKHNASDGGKKDGADDSNIIGLASTLNELAANQWQGHVVIGIYISWRGGLVSPYWPVSQQFTYWDREATAARVGNTSLTDSLIEISDAAHAAVRCGPRDACSKTTACLDRIKMTQQERDAAGQSCSPILLYVGHSFGALVLERAISQAMVTRLEREWDEQAAARTRAKALGGAAQAEEAQSPLQFTPMASLIIFVNSAAAATESKQMMDYLASSRFTYEPSNGSQGATQPGNDRPLFLSVTSESDSATGVFLKVGHAVPWLRYKFQGSMRSATPGGSGQQTTSYARACFEPETGLASIRTDLSQSDYYMSTTAHKQQLWSHEVSAKPAPVDGKQDPHCDRMNPSPSGVFETCRIGQVDYAVKPVQGRCNGTPYWVLEVQKEIVPDHNTIFTDRLIAFLIPFIPRPDEPGEVLRPLLTKPEPHQ